MIFPPTATAAFSHQQFMLFPRRERICHSTDGVRCQRANQQMPGKLSAAFRGRTAPRRSSTPAFPAAPTPDRRRHGDGLPKPRPDPRRRRVAPLGAQTLRQDARIPIPLSHRAGYHRRGRGRRIEGQRPINADQGTSGRSGVGVRIFRFSHGDEERADDGTGRFATWFAKRSRGTRAGMN